jgi:phosphohistidine swiveling domain-containing protein
MGATSSIHLFSDELKRRVAYRKRFHIVTKAIKLPPLIFEKRDVENFELPSSKPNFVGTKTVMADRISLDECDMRDMDLSGKIVMIEHADPGFDWIFNHDIIGLVTKYGGVASHMAIRCAEFDLTAVIGCGEKLYDRLKSMKRLEIDPHKEILKGL